MKANNLIENLTPIATYGGIMASMLCASLEVQAAESFDMAQVNTIQSTSPIDNCISSIESYNFMSSHNVFSSVHNDASSILTKFVKSIMEDSKPLNPEVEEYINDIFWDLV